jgi:short-subunit dehydrogenase
VTLVARRAEKLTELADELATAHGVRTEVLTCDLTDPGARDALPGRVAELGLRVDVLVHNAGFDQPGRFLGTDLGRQVEITRIFCEATVALCHLFGASMAERGAGGILIVSSSSGFQPTPNDAAYGASKAFQNAFADALHAELRSDGVAVTALCPGPVLTPFIDVSGPHPAHNSIPKFAFVSAPKVAKAGVDGLAAGKRVVVPGPMRAIVASGRLAPRALQLRVFARLYK